MGQRFVVLDFETTGLSIRSGDRAIEVAAVEVVDGQLGNNYASLINTGLPVGSFITGLTGITNSMLQLAPYAKTVMTRLAQFVGQSPIVAHNASFDAGFFRNEMLLHGVQIDCKFLCSVRIARRLYPRSPNYKLSTLAEYIDVPLKCSHHRALADAELTAQIFVAMCGDMRAKYGIRDISFSLLQRLQNISIANSHAWLTRRGLSKSK